MDFCRYLCYGNSGLKQNTYIALSGAERSDMTINLEYFKVFYHVAKSGSVTKAADKLSISQPAVSQSLKQLEQTLGAILFQRKSKGVELTAEGRMLFHYVEKGYEQIEQGVKKLKQMQDLEVGQVHIGASDMTLQFYLLPYLERFHAMYPEIKVMVTNAPTPETLQLLESGKIDFGVVSAPVEERIGIKIRALREIQDVFVAGREFAEVADKRLGLEELENLPLICLEKNTSTRSYIDAYLAKHSVVLQPEFELATSDMIVQFAKRNLGVGCVVRDFAEEALREGSLRELQFEREIPKRHFCLVTDEKAVLSSAARKLLDMMKGKD